MRTYCLATTLARTIFFGLCVFLMIPQVAYSALTVRSDGAELVYRPSSPASAQNPAFSPDSKTLLFTVFDNGYNIGPAGLYLLPIDSAAPKLLWQDADHDAVNLPGTSWNKQKNLITFSSDRADDLTEIWTIKADSTNLQRVTNHATSNPGYLFFEPSFSPNGEWLVFEVNDGSPAAQGSIWKVKIDGTGLAMLTDGPGSNTDDRQPNWSPLGDHILFQRRVVGSDDWNIYTMKTDGSVVKKVTTSPLSDTDASWSPDGKYIVYSSDQGDLTLPNIFAIPAAGGTPVRVTNSNTYDGAVSWSSDNMWIYFESSSLSDLPTSIWRIAVPASLKPSITVSPAAPPAVFSDVTESHPNYTAIMDLKRRGIISGYPDGTFKPDQVVNRVEALKIILLGAEIAVSETVGSLRFSDTDPAAWYAKYLSKAAEIGIVQGYPDGTFKPAQTVNLVENLKMLLLANNVDLSVITVSGNPYTDAFADQWYIKYVQYAKDKNLIDADAQNRIFPAQGMTRGKLAEAMYRLLLSGARAFWKPNVDDTFQWQLTGIIDTSVTADVYDLEMFDTSVATITSLHSEGKKVICYISAGSWENWRSDKANFPSEIIGKDYAGWNGEKWLDVRRIDLLGPIMEKRFDMAKEKGCDAIEPDNIDGFGADSGFTISYNDQLTYNLWLANEAHERGMSIGLKNDPEHAADLLAHYDWALTEDCHVQGWCDDVKLFREAGKAVFQVEYSDTGVKLDDFCPKAATNRYIALLKNRDLDAWRTSCP